MRCPDCNRFVSLDSEVEPEVDVDINEEGQVTGTARMVNACGECGGELTEYTFDLDEEADDATAHMESFPEDQRGKHKFTCEGSASRMDSFGKGSRPAHFYGVSVDILVKCECGKHESTVTIEDQVQASDMDSLT